MVSIIQKQCRDTCGCSSDEDCGKGFVCTDHVCKRKAECHDNRECDGRVCESGKCVPCTATASCGRPDAKCVDGRCVAATDPRPADCTKSTDCGEVQVCKDGKCSSCSTDAECGDGKLCSAGQCIPKPPTCGQPGFEWAQWRGPRSWGKVKSPPFAEFDPSAFKIQAPEHSGRTNSLIITDPRRLYGEAIATNLAAVIHQGFLLAPETGNFTFIFGQADDIALVWLGNLAYSGWTRANADIERTYIPPPGDETRTVRHLEQGTYYPVRVAWGDKGGNVALSVKIVAPNGTELTGQDGGYFRTEACDGSYGKFPAYGPPQ
ncbi:hypothetical protein UVI_02005290 [Ustilaginoidea virens]|nr:hypothetical protein UVI_02005290 [Ustilaginoidea virens]